MAPATSGGAATPVQIGGAPTPEDTEDQDPDEERERRPSPRDAAERKAINDAVSYIRGLAEQRDRNADWAEQAVREAVSINSREALEKNVINILARDFEDLLEQLHGMEVETTAGMLRINTTDMTLERIEPDWRTELLSVLTNPTVAYLLMLIGIYGLIFEGYNPGAIVPGVVGAICLLLALFAFQVLPVNYAGFALIALGIILIISEAFVPSFGILGIGGLISFIIGSIILMDTDVPGFGIPLPLIAGISIVGGLVTFSIIGFALRARQTPIVSGQEEMVGMLATAREDFEDTGRVWVRSEVWRGQARRPVHKGQKLRVTAVDGLVLQVEPLDDDPKDSSTKSED
jgi:membrane-bound serine protease (ClpP class)